MQRMNRIIAAMLLCLFSTLTFAQVRELPSPAAAGSGQPNLAVAPDGRVYLSWLERASEGRYTLRFSIKEGNGWSAPQTIAEGANWFANWADFPSFIALPDGSLAAHWLVKNGAGYDINIARSFDGGKTWSKPILPHRDGTLTEHGFVSMFPARDGLLAAVWLDGRETKPSADGHGHGSMTLRYATIKRDGSLADETALDIRVCDCCQTSAAMTADGPVIVYRDRSDEEVRDISVMRWQAGKWSAPRLVHRDGWQISACPVNGPSVAASGKRVAVAWFTAANSVLRVFAAFSHDAGETFGEPVKVDDGNPAGRVETLLLADGSAMVVWLEKLEGGGEVRARRVWPNGKRGKTIIIASSGTARSNGFPQMVRSGEKIIFAWTGSSVMTAEMPLPEK